MQLKATSLVKMAESMAPIFYQQPDGRWMTVDNRPFVVKYKTQLLIGAAIFLAFKLLK